MFKQRKLQQESYARTARLDALDRFVMSLERLTLNMVKKNQELENRTIISEAALVQLETSVRQLTSEVALLHARMPAITVPSMMDGVIAPNGGIEFKPGHTYRPVVEAYCVKCKEKRAMQGMRIKVSDSGRRMAQGTCAVCSTKMNRILGKVAE